MIGLYIVFEIAGLANVALTVVGGTGILGIVLGIAFRDISENFLASIFLSLQNPFQTGDLVDINGQKGFVQALTTRVTVLMTLDGNQIQIPNATVYKNNILNYTSNPNLRLDFTIGIGYADSITKAQELALKILGEHPAVLKDPEPWALVESIGQFKREPADLFLGRYQPAQRFEGKVGLDPANKKRLSQGKYQHPRPSPRADFSARLAHPADRHQAQVGV